VCAPKHVKTVVWCLPPKIGFSGRNSNALIPQGVDSLFFL
jgi:hypothetical protein